MMTMIVWMFSAFLLGLPAQDPLDNWPQFRGPNGDGVAPRADPPVRWSETKNITGKVELPGSGSATPVVWGDRIFILTAVDTKKEKPGAPKPPSSPDPGMSVASPGTLHLFDVLCLDRATGKTVWRRTAVEEVPHEGHHPTNGYASCSPATDGKILI